MVSVILTGHDYDSIMKQISHFCRQTYRNVEMIFVDHFHESCEADEKRERAKFNNFLKRRNVTTVKYERTYGYAYEPVSCEELFVFGMKQAKGDYVILSKDYVTYNNTFIETAVEKAVKEDADFVYTDLVVSWKEGTASRYFHEILTNGEAPYNEYIKHAGKLFGLDSETNKLIKTELCWKVCDEITGFYVRGNRASAFAGEAVFGAALWARAEKAVYVPEVFSIVDWEAEDKTISDYAGERNTGKVVEEIGAVFQFVHNRCTEAKIDKVQEDTYKADTISRFVWRSGWAVANLKSDLENKYGISIKEYSIMDAFLGRISDIDISEAEAVPQEILELDQDMKIKIFISMHKPSFVPENKYLIPIQMGAAIADKRFENTFHDDEGENISAKNRCYCELTAQYWAWKNCPDEDYYGFWHYRRFFSFNENEKSQAGECITHEILNYDSMEKSCIDEKHIEDVCKNYDMILPRPWVCCEDGRQMTTYEQWCKHFNKDDLDIAVKVIIKRFPEYYDAAMDVLQADSIPVCNMFIMKKELFQEYSNFLFTVLEDVESLIDQKLYNPEEYRTLGHLGERMLAIFARYVELTKPDVDICYLERTIYDDTRPVAKVKHLVKDNCVSVMLACNDIYMPYTDVLLQSICDNADDKYFYDVVILHRDITEYNQTMAKNIFVRKKNMLLRFADVTRNFEKYAKVHVDRHLTLETYYRFLALDVFEGYDRVLYIDCDTVVNADLADLFFTEMEDEYIAATRDYDLIAQCVYNKEWYREHVLKYINIDDFFNYFQAGVILFNLKNMKKEFSSEMLFNVALSRNWHFHDQDVLNSLLNGHIKYVENKWNVFSLLDEKSPRRELLLKALAADFAQDYKNSRKNPAIIHFAGVPKVWNDTSVDLGYIFWQYARRSPFYERLIYDLIGDPAKNDWMTFICQYTENVGIDFFTIKTLKEVWSSNYAVIDFMYLSNHNVIETDTLTISTSLFLKDQGGAWLDVMQFRWDKKIPVFAENILFNIDENNDLKIYARMTEQYAGFSFTVRTLESRTQCKPTIEVNNNHFVENPIVLSENLRKGW